jgi:protein-disulfide isomerase
MTFDRKLPFGVFTTCLLLVTLLVPGLAFPADSDSGPSYQDLQKQIEQLRQDYKTLKGQLTEIRELLQGRPSPEPAVPANLTLNIGGSPFKGDRDAKLTLVEFSDYECPF